MTVWWTSDLHLGHKNIHNFRKEVESCEHNSEMIESHWRELVTKRDVVWVLGDIAFTDEGFGLFRSLPGIKKVCLGNHDPYPAYRYNLVCDEVRGLWKYKGKAWLSHAPIHPNELRGKINIHGHVHYQSVDDERYFNCCVENCLRLTGKSLISLEQLRDMGVLLKCLCSVVHQRRTKDE